MKTFKVIRFAILSSTAVLVSSTWAQTSAPTCNSVAHEKRLAGAAKTSFLKKCEREAIEKCEAAATERKLAGAAKNSNVKKCVKEVVGE
jgi:hypothetical protein